MYKMHERNSETSGGGSWEMEDGRWEMEDGSSMNWREVPTPPESRSQRHLEPAGRRPAPQPENWDNLQRVAGAWKEMAHNNQGATRRVSGDLRSNRSNLLPGSGIAVRLCAGQSVRRGRKYDKVGKRCELVL